MGGSKRKTGPICRSSYGERCSKQHSAIYPQIINPCQVATRQHTKYVLARWCTRIRSFIGEPHEYLSLPLSDPGSQVYWGHHELWAHEPINPEQVFENTFGYEGRYHFVTFPGVRTFFSGGHFAVSIFFVISGYVLSNKPLQYIHAEDFLKLGDNVASALFRRWIRLFTPIICVTFCYMASWHAFGIRTEVAAESNFGAELWKWFKEFRDFSFVFQANGKPGFTYSFHVWSIPTEFRGSMVIYVSLLSFARMARNARLWCSIALIFYFLYIVDGWYCAMFMMGMLQCDLNNLATGGNLPTNMSRVTRFKRPIAWVGFVVGIYLGGCPAASNDHTILSRSPGWHYLSYLKPEAMYDFKWFYLFCAASLTLASIPQIPLIKQFFELRFNQYLGRISFAFYLVHGPVMWTIADRLYAATGCVRVSHATTAPGWINLVSIPHIGPVGLELDYLLPHVLILPITLWTAEIATKLFDEPSVRLSHWLYRKAQKISQPKEIV